MERENIECEKLIEASEPNDEEVIKLLSEFSKMNVIEPNKPICLQIYCQRTIHN